MLRIGQRESLSVIEREQLSALARLRVEAFSSTSKRQSVHESERLANMMNATFCEYAFCRMVNVFFSFDVVESRAPRFDCVLDDGRSVDVKTPMRGFDLCVEPSKRKSPCDLYAVVRMAGTNAIFCGAATWRQIFVDENLREFGQYNSRAYVLPSGSLSDLR